MNTHHLFGLFPDRRRTTRAKSTPAKRPAKGRLGVELLEDRVVPAAVTYTVNNTLDIGPGSLRQAILDANTNTGTDTIEFCIMGAGVHTIQPLSQLPTITDPVVINGYTQPGATPNTNGPGLGDNAVLQIELDGSLAGAGSSGLVISAGSSRVCGLTVNRFDGNGIVLSTSGGNTIAGNFIGTDSSGTSALGNGHDGVGTNGCNSNTIGGTTPESRNVISGNRFAGIELQPSSDNVIQGNFIGTDATGKVALSTAAGFRSGVMIFGGNNNVIGGTVAGARNLISGNMGSVAGVEIYTEGVGNNRVLGNYIGTDVTGCFAVPNNVGVFAAVGENSIPTLVGGTDPGSRNLISGNSVFGVSLTHGIALGNLIGTDFTGTKAIGNGTGVFLNFHTRLGGPQTGARNIVSGNYDVGVRVANGHNFVQGNYIGTDITGTAALSNGVGVAGIYLTSGDGDLIGGTDPGAGNVIANNGYREVFVANSSGPVTIQGNFIGTDKSGNVPMGFSNFAVHIENASNVLLGGTVPGARNVIGNASVGVWIGDVGSVNNVVQGNSIGLGADGVTPVSNNSGIGLAGGTSHNTIGGTDPGAGNVIANNLSSGVGLSQYHLAPFTTGNAILGNSIYNNGGLGIDIAQPDGENVDGPNANDSGDVDDGNNAMQNYPVVTTVLNEFGTTIVQGKLNSTPNFGFRIELFSNSAVDPSGYGEGEQYLGFTYVSADSNGDAYFNFMLTNVSLAGKYLTATATDSDGNTSEFSLAYQAPLNSLPTANAGGPYAVAEGGSVMLNGAGSSDPDQSSATLNYAWDFDNDGQFDDATGVSPTFLAGGLDGFAGLFVTVRMRVTDAGGLFDDDITTIAIGNVAPTATITGPASGQQGLTLTFQATGVTDPGTVDTTTGFSYSWQVSRGVTPIDLTGVATNGSALSFVPTEAGTYCVTLTVTDKDGGATTVHQTVLVTDGSGITFADGVLVIVGTSGDDDIKVNPGGGAPEIKVILNGVQTTWVGVTEIVIYANAGDDRVQIAGGITLPVTAFGGTGDDRLKAGGGTSMLVGGDGNDSLLGGSGRDVLIGGAGADLIGGSGADDILVASSTAFDTNLAALRLIRVEWTSSRSFADRVANLSGTGITGVNGPVVLRSTGSNPTVVDDNAVDRLTGDGGSDWFVFNSVGGVYVDQVTDMTAFEGLFDMDL